MHLYRASLLNRSGARARHRSPRLRGPPSRRASPRDGRRGRRMRPLRWKRRHRRPRVGTGGRRPGPPGGRVSPRRLERRRRLVVCARGDVPRQRRRDAERLARLRRRRRRAGAGRFERRRVRHRVTRTSCRSTRTRPLRPVTPYAASKVAADYLGVAGVARWRLTGAPRPRVQPPRPRTEPGSSPPHSPNALRPTSSTAGRSCRSATCRLDATSPTCVTSSAPIASWSNGASRARPTTCVQDERSPCRKSRSGC